MKKILTVCTVVLFVLVVSGVALAGGQRGSKPSVIRWSNTPFTIESFDFSEANTFGDSTDVPLNIQGNPITIQAVVMQVKDAFKKNNPHLKITNMQEIYWIHNIDPPFTADVDLLYVISIRIDHEPRK